CLSYFSLPDAAVRTFLYRLPLTVEPARPAVAGAPPAPTKRSTHVMWDHCVPARRDPSMQRKITGTWHDDPAHFRRVSRRDFLFVGLAGGLGLTMADLFRLQAAEGKAEPKEGKAESLIHIFMPGGLDHQE